MWILRARAWIYVALTMSFAITMSQLLSVRREPSRLLTATHRRSSEGVTIKIPRRIGDDDDLAVTVEAAEFT